MRALTSLLAPLATLIAGVTPVQAADTVTGSGVVIGAHGEILTNSHVVEDCQQITVQLPSKSTETAVLVARDQKNDLAVVRIDTHPTSVAIFREGAPLRAGDTVVALGYPLSGLLATTANLSVGNVSALAGLGDNSRYVQISAPVQPGNSGGPLLDASGHLVGIVTAKLNAARVAQFTGDIPQNVNFALKVEVARTFLDSNGIVYQGGRSDQQLSAADVGDIARPFTVRIECKQDGSRSAAAAPAVSRPPRTSTIEPTPQQLLSWCEGKGTPSPDLIINSCTATIQSGRRSGKNLSPALNNRGIGYNRKAEYDRAIADFDRGDPPRPEICQRIHQPRASLIAARATTTEPSPTMTEAIRLDPNNASAYNNRGFAYGSKGDYDRAIADYTEAIRLDPKYRHAPTTTAASPIAQGGRTTGPSPTTTEAIRLDPKMPWPTTTAASPSRSKGDTTGPSPTSPRRSASTRKMRVAFNNRGLAYRSKGEYDRAIADYDRGDPPRPEKCPRIQRPRFHLLPKSRLPCCCGRSFAVDRTKGKCLSDAVALPRAHPHR